MNLSENQGKSERILARKKDRNLMKFVINAAPEIV